MVEETENILSSEESVDLYTESVNSTIQGYRGAKDRLAALAQEPTQNAKDNPMKEGDVPHIVFELIKKDNSYMLTITDENTKGLDGKRMKPKEVLKLVNEGKSNLVSNFTAMHSDNLSPKKFGGNKSGSRGQGKKSLLYHSRHLNKSGVEVMYVLIDSLAKDENNTNLTYRSIFLGALPQKVPAIARDQKEAKSWLKEIDLTKIKDKGILLSEMGLKENKIKLGLKALTKNGTRITIPYLHESTVEGFLDGTFKKWLERIWWKAIIDEKIKITLKIPGNRSEVIKPLDCWKDKPWENDSVGVEINKFKGTKVWNNIEAFNSSARLDAAKKFRESKNKIKIKRIVFDWDSERESDEINDSSDQNELNGVQWIRSGQWIKTDDIEKLSSTASISDSSFKNGFRGFIEFDEATEAYLKNDEVETPQHDGYQSPNNDIKKIKYIIQEKFEELALEVGWKEVNQGEEQIERGALDNLLNLGLFGSGKGTSTNGLSSQVIFSNPENFFKWGDEIKDIASELKSDDTNKSIRECIYPKNRLLPNKKPSEVYNSDWDEIEETLAIIIYKLYGKKPDYNSILVKKFIDFSVRSKKSLVFKLGNCEAIENGIERGGSSPFSNYSKSLPNLFDKYFNMENNKLLELFDKIVNDRQKQIEFSENLSVRLSILNPDGEIFEIENARSEFDLNENLIREDTFPNIKLTKSNGFDKKGTYRIKVEWIDYFEIVQVSAYRNFYLEEKPDTPDLADLSLYLDINNLSAIDNNKNFNYGDEIEINVLARNRTEKEFVMAFNAYLIGDIDNDIESEDNIIDVQGRNLGSEYTDTNIFKFKRLITMKSPAGNGEIHLPKGRTEFKLDLFDISDKERRQPTPIEKINEFSLKSTELKPKNQYFVKDSIWVEREKIDRGDEPFLWKSKTEDGSGNPAWEFGKGYLEDEQPSIIQYLYHPQTIKAKNGIKKDDTFTEQNLKDSIVSEATVKLLIERLSDTQNRALLEEFKKNSNSLKTNNLKALNVWQNQLSLLEKIDFHELTIPEYNVLFQKLSNSLYLMLLQTS